MKYLPILIAVLLMTSCSNQQATQESFDDIKWMSLNEVQKVNKKNPRKVLVDVYTPWCGPCKMMMNSTFKDPELINYLGKNYHAVKFNAEGPDPVNVKGKEYSNPQFNSTLPANRRNSMHQYTATLGVRGYPTIVVFDPELNKIDQSVGLKSAVDLMAFLKGLDES